MCSKPKVKVQQTAPSAPAVSAPVTEAITKDTETPIQQQRRRSKGKKALSLDSQGNLSVGTGVNV